VGVLLTVPLVRSVSPRTCGVWKRRVARWLERWGSLVVRRVLFPIVTGEIAAGLRAALAARAESYCSSVLVQPKLPIAKHSRMVTVRDDGGPQDDMIQRRSFGFNVWAETSVDAEKLARMCMGILPTLADGSPIVGVSNLSGPFEVIDQGTDLYAVGTTTLSHYYFSAQIASRGGDL
jgi:hypothetical protein